MALTDIRLQNYRSYSDSSFELSPGVNIVVGPNAVGKSNLIESLLLILNNQAYRGKSELVRKGADWARIDVHTDKNELRTVKIKNSQPRQEIIYEIGGRVYTRLPFSQKSPAVLFEPNNLFLLSDDPSGRRTYFDQLIAQNTKDYASTLLKYKRALTQRNTLLKIRPDDTSQLFVWSLRLSELADRIVKLRLETLEKINHKTSETYSEIAHKKSSLTLEYKSSVRTDNNYSASLLKKLESNIDEDRQRGFTVFGPHRDDFLVVLNSQPAVHFASRGEVRTIILTLKIIQLVLLEESTARKPLFLLDDVFSELDGARRKALTNYLKDYQAVITTTDADIIMKSFSQKAQIVAL